MDNAKGENNMNKLKIAVLFGGRGEEHPVSVKSAQQIAKHLNTKKYELYWVGITQDGEWKLCSGPDADLKNGDCQPAILSPDKSIHGLLVQYQDRYETVRLDVILPVLHGKFGEDGAIQGLLELSDIPYVGCDIQSSAVCMDKSLTYAVVNNAKIATPNFRIIMAHEIINPDDFAYPVVVKPARSGSSFGVNKVDQKEDLLSAIDDARQYDSKLLIEEVVVGTEVGCAIMGNDKELILGEVDQIRLSHGVFRPHQEDDPEHGSENSTVIVPADISPEARVRVQETAKAIYRALGCGGLARVDMFLTEDGKIALNEVNTFPGMTSYSRYPRMMKAAGLSISEVIDQWVAFALERKAGTSR